MIAFPAALVNPAKQAGIKVPDDLENYDVEQYPYWHVFSCMQLGSPMPSTTSHWINAKIIAEIPESEIKTVTREQVIERGFEFGHSIP